ncbi:hypothetical protein GCM10009809_12800 [Isoptericola hypogeus]|uniref:Helicase/secretion neighborhood CpaE-like protein n=1 Tax=Isoptericola hypogeus TaxID=300179 RepID=A0ABP4VAB5_9MICO
MDKAPGSSTRPLAPTALTPAAAGAVAPPAPTGVPWFTGPADPRRASRTVAVVGACGGAGTSTVAAAVAHGLRRSAERAVLVDLDVPGGGADVLLGVEDEPGARWPELAAARGDVDGEGLVAALPRWRTVPVLSASRQQADGPDDAVVVDVATALLRAGESVVLDLPRPTAWSPAARLLASAADVVLLVVPCTVPGAAGAVSTCALLRGAQVREPWVVARRPVPGRVDAAALEAALGLDVVAEARWDARLADAVDRGEGPPLGRRSPLGRLAAGLATALQDAP